MTGANDTTIHRTIDAVWRIESAKLIAGLTRMVRDVGLAEDFAQDALVAALEQWPASGVPDNPAAWLMSTAKRRAIDAFRRDALHQEKHEQIVAELDEGRDTVGELVAAMDDHVGDDLLRLIFATCHPALSMEARAALTLRLLGGLTTAEIARAFVVAEATIAQRIVRAKRTLSETTKSLDVPRGAELADRVASVLQVVYLIFNEGYAATAGDDLMRPALCEDALRLGRVLQGLMADEAEVHGLVALMEIQSSRTATRIGPSGEPVLLLEQDRGRWNRMAIQRGLSALTRAESIGAARGPYTIQAAIAACHARATTARETDWRRIVELYGELAERDPSPVVELNRAVAVSMAFGAEAALPLVEALMKEASLARYHLLPAVRGDLLARLGRTAEARADFERAASLTLNARERAALLGRAREME